MIGKAWIGLTVLWMGLATSACSSQDKHEYNGSYQGEYLNRVAFPLGGIGAGMVCLDGMGSVSHVSVRHHLDFFSEPMIFGAICVKGAENGAKLLEGPVPPRRIFGKPDAARGLRQSHIGLPRFEKAEFTARFPFAAVKLQDSDIPLEIEVTGWSPFTPGDADSSSLPVGALEYRFSNPSSTSVDAVFSFHSENFMKTAEKGSKILPLKNGFILWQDTTEFKPYDQGGFAIFVDDDRTVVDHSWFKGDRWHMAMVWQNIQKGRLLDNPPQNAPASGASLFVPLTLKSGEQKTIRVMFAWYVPHSGLFSARYPLAISAADCSSVCSSSCSSDSPASCDAGSSYVPWYAGKFAGIREVSQYWRTNYDSLKQRSEQFRDAFYRSSLPPEVLEAVGANLTILKSPTILRQKDGRLWCWEGCRDDSGCCPGSCTHVWNYNQAICHLFPDLERGMRDTEYFICQDENGHQTHRASLPIQPVSHDCLAVADGQLGGILKVYREWRISGDTDWLRRFWLPVKQSLNYCIATWDPRRRGVLEEPHHNTYDIEFWGPNSMCSSFYLAAFTAAIEMGTVMGDDVSQYQDLLSKGRQILETELFNGEYFYQKVQSQGLNATFEPLKETESGPGYVDISAQVNQQGPRFQYGTGCLADGVIGFWLAQMCGLDREIVDAGKIRSHLAAVYRYNMKHDLSDFANPQRPNYALGAEGGLLLCTWPKGDASIIPFNYSNEVFTGVEYYVAGFMISNGMIKEGLDIVRTARDRYDGRVRNPFDEYECGHWYGRALSSYGLLQSLTGVRYDAVKKTLYIDSRIGDDFTTFLSAATGFGNVGLKQGKPFIKIVSGSLDVQSVIVSGKKMELLN